MARGEWALAGLSVDQAAMVVLLMTPLGSLAPFPYYAFTQDLSTRHMGLVTGLLSFCAWVVPSSIQRMLGEEIDRSGAYDIAFHVASWPVLSAAVALSLFWDVGWLRGAKGTGHTLTVPTGGARAHACRVEAHLDAWANPAETWTKPAPN